MIIIDVETTGFGHNDRIIEVAALETGTGKEWHTLINPQIKVPEFITKLTGITSEMVETAPYFADVSETLRKMIGRQAILGYNVAFDKRFLVKEDPKFNCFAYKDFLKYVRSLGHKTKNNKLSTVAEFFEISIVGAHRALKDVQTVYQLYKRLGYEDPDII